MHKIELKIKNCESIGDLREFIKSNNIRLILFGEYHGFSKQIPILIKIIKNIRPKFFLYEMLEEKKILNNKDFKRFLGKPNSENFSFISIYGQLKPIIRLARSFNLPIIGCDIKNMAVNENWREKRFSKKEAKTITRKRELQQVKIINKYISKGLVFVLSGDYHLRKDSPIFSKLKAKKAIFIRPSFKWEDRFSQANKFKDSEVFYTIKLYQK